MQRTNTLYIKTPEGITFALLLAGPVARFLAWMIDLACISVIMMALNMGIQFTVIVSADFAQAVALISYFLVSIGYGIFCEWYYKGQTLGKRLISIRVMDIQGLRLQFSQIVIRNLLRFIDSLPVCYLVGGLSCLLSPKAQRLGDFAANTITIREPKIPRPDFEQLLTHKYNSLRGHPHLVARLRQRTSPLRQILPSRPCSEGMNWIPYPESNFSRSLRSISKRPFPFPRKSPTESQRSSSSAMWWRSFS